MSESGNMDQEHSIPDIDTGKHRPNMKDALSRDRRKKTAEESKKEAETEKFLHGFAEILARRVPELSSKLKAPLGPYVATMVSLGKDVLEEQGYEWGLTSWMVDLIQGGDNLAYGLVSGEVDLYEKRGREHPTPHPTFYRHTLKTDDVDRFIAKAAGVNNYEHLAGLTTYGDVTRYSGNRSFKIHHLLDKVALGVNLYWGDFENGDIKELGVYSTSAPEYPRDYWEIAQWMVDLKVGLTIYLSPGEINSYQYSRPGNRMVHSPFGFVPESIIDFEDIYKHTHIDHDLFVRDSYGYPTQEPYKRTLRDIEDDMVQCFNAVHDNPDSKWHIPGIPETYSSLSARARLTGDRLKKTNINTERDTLSGMNPRNVSGAVPLNVDYSAPTWFDLQLANLNNAGLRTDVDRLLREHGLSPSSGWD